MIFALEIYFSFIIQKQFFSLPLAKVNGGLPSPAGKIQGAWV